MINTFEEVKKILFEALWMAYCSGRANNEYIPEEVIPDLMKRCQLFEPKPEEELQKDIGNIIAEYSCNPEDYSLVNTVKEIMSRIRRGK